MNGYWSAVDWTNSSWDTNAGWSFSWYQKRNCKTGEYPDNLVVHFERLGAMVYNDDSKRFCYPPYNWVVAA